MFANASGFSRQQHVSLSLRYGFNQTLQTSASGFFQPRLASRSSQPRIPDTCRISYYRTLQSNVLYYATRTKQTFSVLTISSQCSKPGSKLESTPRHVHTYICHASQGPDVQGASRVEPSEAARARGRGGRGERGRPEVLHTRSDPRSSPRISPSTAARPPPGRLRTAGSRRTYARTPRAPGRSKPRENGNALE